MDVSLRPATPADATLLADLGARTFREACEARARSRGADVLWLGVWEHNAEALTFHARGGFRQVGEHGFPIGSRVHRDLVLAKDLL